MLHPYWIRKYRAYHDDFPVVDWIYIIIPHSANGAKADFTFGLIDEEINAIEAQKRRDEIEETLRVQDMIHAAAKNNKSYITLPTQSEQSAALSHLVHSYKNAGKHKIQHKASKKNARAARYVLFHILFRFSSFFRSLV